LETEKRPLYSFDYYKINKRRGKTDLQKISVESN
jgi:hypothetical protein